jgi:hypothetical protein
MGQSALSNKELNNLYASLIFCKTGISNNNHEAMLIKTNLKLIQDGKVTVFSG